MKIPGMEVGGPTFEFTIINIITSMTEFLSHALLQKTRLIHMGFLLEDCV